MSPPEQPVLTGLDKGTTAPNFGGKNVCEDDAPFDLHELAKNHRGIILTFFRGAW